MSGLEKYGHAKFKDGKGRQMSAKNNKFYLANCLCSRYLRFPGPGPGNVRI